MRKFVFACVVSAALASCGSEKSGSYEAEDGDTVDYSVETTGGESTATIKTEDGTATVRSGADVKIDLPKGFTLYPGAKVVTNTVFDGQGQKGAMVVMQSDDDPVKLVAFYRKQASAAGFNIAIEMKTDQSTMIGGEGSEGEGGFTFNASTQNGKTTGQLMVGDSFN